MDLKEIATSIASWNILRNEKNSSQIISLFANGNCFFYESYGPKRPEGSYLHVYLGVGVNGKLQLFLIDSDKDTLEQSKSSEGILPFITVCTLPDSPGLGSEIPVEQALLRIEDWKENHSEWISNQVESEDNIFQAFAIPSSDIAEGRRLQIYFALKPNPDGGNAYADLIIFDKDDAGKLLNVSKYFDLVRPVPPFHIAGPLEKENFYLLEISE